MGEAKRKKGIQSRNRDKIFAECPYCIYCGVKLIDPEWDLDHVPARSYFLGRDRPKGLEVPSCKPCNRGAAGDELIIAHLSRIYPERYHHLTKDEMGVLNKERDKYKSDVKRQFPGLIEEMEKPSRDQEKHVQDNFGSGYGVYNTDIPIIKSAILRFCAKIGYALHFNRTGNFVLEGQGANIDSFSHTTALTDSYMNAIKEFKRTAEERTLIQGKKEVRKQFRCWNRSGVEDCPGNRWVSMHYVEFRLAFGAFIFIAEKEVILKCKGTKNFYAPGFLKQKSRES